MDEKDEAQEPTPGWEVIVRAPWNVVPAMPGWVQITFGHPRLGLLHFLMPLVAAQAMREQLQTAITPTASDSSPPGPYH